MIDLSHILTPKLYDRILDINFPWEGPVDIEFASKFWFEGEPDNSKEVYDACHHPALKPLSTLCPDIPSLRDYLPRPNDSRYPEHTLALRYTYMFFDQTSKVLVKELLAAGVFPDDLRQWTTLGYSFEDAMVRKFWLYSPLIHSEELGDHDLVKTKIEEMRRDVEAYSGRRDPGRDTWEEDAKDVTLFARLVQGEPPKTFADFFFWLFRVFDAHRPIIERYGRYPYRNVAQGRETSEAEEHYLQLTENFGVPELSEEEVQKLKKQVKEDVWDPLSDSVPA